MDGFSHSAQLRFDRCAFRIRSPFTRPQEWLLLRLVELDLTRHYRGLEHVVHATRVDLLVLPSLEFMKLSAQRLLILVMARHDGMGLLARRPVMRCWSMPLRSLWTSDWGIVGVMVPVRLGAMDHACCTRG